MNAEQINVKTGKKPPEVLKIALYALLALTFWTAVWWLLSYKVGKAWVLPSPRGVFLAFVEAAKTGTLFARAGRSLAGVAAGYLAGTVCGALLALLCAKVRFFHHLFSPLLTVVRATPVASFILILWVFFSSARGYVPAVCVLLIVLPVVWANCETGILSADKKLLEAAKVYRMGFFKKLRYIYLPALFPYFRTAALTALGMAWKAGIAAEVICTPKGTVGEMIWFAKRDFQTGDLFAYTLLVILVCFLLEKLLGLLLKLPYRRKEAKK